MESLDGQTLIANVIKEISITGSCSVTIGRDIQSGLCCIKSDTLVKCTVTQNKLEIIPFVACDWVWCCIPIKNKTFKYDKKWSINADYKINCVNLVGSGSINFVNNMILDGERSFVCKKSRRETNHSEMWQGQCGRAMATLCRMGLE